MTPAALADNAALEPPPRFRGAFLSQDEALDRMGSAAGPFRLRPRAVAVPADVDDVALLVSWATEEGIPLVPRGAGTGMPGGNVGPGVSLDLSALSDLGDVDPATGRVAAGPGATGAALEGAASAVGRFFPALPSSADRCTLGGMVANNAAGARSYGHGAVHAWVDGVEAVLPGGAVRRFFRGDSDPAFLRLRDALAPGLSPLPWPRVRKNASGYPLDRFLPSAEPLELLVGSEGTLAVLTRLWLRTALLPEERALVLLPVPEVEALDSLVESAGGTGISVCEFFGDRFLEISGLRGDPGVGPLLEGHPALLLLEVEGRADVVEAGVDALLGLARDMGVAVRVGRSREERDRLWRVRHAASPVVAAQAERGLVSMQFIEDSVVPPGRLARYLRGLEDILAGEETDAVLFGHAGDGNVHVNPLVDVGRPDWRGRVSRILDRTVELVAELGGTLSGEHGDGRVRAPFHRRIFGAAVAAAFGRVKATLDPSSVLNPGVVVPREGQDPLEGLSPHRRIG